MKKCHYCCFGGGGYDHIQCFIKSLINYFTFHCTLFFCLHLNFKMCICNFKLKIIIKHVQFTIYLLEIYLIYTVATQG